ncbi:MAG: hypothetical protein LBP59_16920 [Planctomycetaceae bacterium]|jgi:hypothetical protein|nr:hypothetical protein [Planctomycetaceae bacterium]
MNLIEGGAVQIFRVVIIFACLLIGDSCYPDCKNKVCSTYKLLALEFEFTIVCLTSDSRL